MKTVWILLTIVCLSALATRPLHAESQPARVLNESVIRKLCPNPNERCLARDNPDFYKDTDPAFYRRITKPAPGYFVYAGEAITHSTEPKLSIRLGEPLAVHDLKKRFSGYTVYATFGADCTYCATVTGRAGSFSIDYDATGVVIVGISSSDRTSVDALGNKIGASLRKIIGPSGNCDSGDALTCESSIDNLEYIVEPETCNMHVQEGFKTQIPACAKIAGFRIWRDRQ